VETELCFTGKRKLNGAPFVLCFHVKHKLVVMVSERQREDEGCNTGETRQNWRQQPEGGRARRKRREVTLLLALLSMHFFLSCLRRSVSTCKQESAAWVSVFKQYPRAGQPTHNCSSLKGSFTFCGSARIGSSSRNDAPVLQSTIDIYSNENVTPRSLRKNCSSPVRVHLNVYLRFPPSTTPKLRQGHILAVRCTIVGSSLKVVYIIRGWYLVAAAHLPFLHL